MQAVGFPLGMDLFLILWTPAFYTEEVTTEFRFNSKNWIESIQLNQFGFQLKWFKFILKF